MWIKNDICFGSAVVGCVEEVCGMRQMGAMGYGWWCQVISVAVAEEDTCI